MASSGSELSSFRRFSETGQTHRKVGTQNYRPTGRFIERFKAAGSPGCRYESYDHDLHSPLLQVEGQAESDAWQIVRFQRQRAQRREASPPAALDPNFFRAACLRRRAPAMAGELKVGRFADRSRRDAVDRRFRQERRHCRTRQTIRRATRSCGQARTGDRRGFQYTPDAPFIRVAFAAWRGAAPAQRNLFGQRASGKPDD